MVCEKPMDVVIVGGSLAGLFTGIVLLRLGHNVTIIERSTPSSLIDQGAGIVVAPYVPPIIVSLTQLGHPSPMFEFFKEYNRSDKPWCKTVTEGSINVLKKDGSIKHVYDLKGMLLGGTSWELLYNSLRANFDGKAENGFIDGVDKKEGDGNARYLHGMQVLSLRDVGGEGVEVQCANKEGGGMTMTANLVVGADGASSAVRNLFLPEIKREHVGYVAWRGIVPKNQVSEATRECFRWPAFFYARGNQAVDYNIPGPKGTIVDDEMVFNVLWYSNYADSAELEDILTDTSGAKHRFILPYGKMRPEIASRQRTRALEILPPQMAEVYQKIENPFVQAVTDSLTTQNLFMDGKVILVGDAVAGIRPHATVGAIQGALHALLLKEVFQETPAMTLEEWAKKSLDWSTGTQKLSVALGQLGQFGDHPMAEN